MGLIVLARLVVSQSRSKAGRCLFRRGGSRRQQNRAQQHDGGNRPRLPSSSGLPACVGTGRPGALGRPVPTQEHIPNQSQQRQCQRNLELLGPANSHPAIVAISPPSPEMGGVQLRQVVRPGPGRNVDPLCLEGDLLQQSPVKFAPDLLPLMFDKHSRIGRRWDPGPGFRVSQPDREDRHFPLGSDGRGIQRVRLLIVTIGYQQDRLISPRKGVENFQRLADRVANRRSAAGVLFGSSSAKARRNES